MLGMDSADDALRAPTTVAGQSSASESQRDSVTDAVRDMSSGLSVLGSAAGRDRVGLESLTAQQPSHGTTESDRGDDTSSQVGNRAQIDPVTAIPAESIAQQPAQSQSTSGSDGRDMVPSTSGRAPSPPRLDSNSMVTGMSIKGKGRLNAPALPVDVTPALPSPEELEDGQIPDIEVSRHDNAFMTVQVSPTTAPPASFYRAAPVLKRG